MKKVFTILFVILAVSVLTVGLFSMEASAATSGTTGDCTWTLKNGVLTISGNGAMGHDLEGGLPWGTSITEVIIEDGVTSIGSFAFAWCKNLTSITIPDSVSIIGEEAFKYTAWLDAQPDGLVYAGKVAYCVKGSCPSSVVIKEGTLGIAERTFWGRTELTSITIPNSVISIGNDAFYKCTGLNSILVDSGNSVYQSAGNCLIEKKSKTLLLGCKTSSIPADGSVAHIGDDAFYKCTSLTSITIPDSVTVIGYNAFRDCTSLTTVTLGKGIRSISDWAFGGCTNLTSVQYNGTKEDRGLVVISSSGNDPLLLADWQYAATYHRGDMNKDGVVNSADAIYLLYYCLFGEERYPL